MSFGLFALLDDVAAIAKVAAASLDDVAAQAAKAGAKAAGVVIDDAAVTPRYVVGFSAERELPIVGKIAVGSLRNKLLLLLPIALALTLFAPWAITPLLMLGGAYLCFEGAEKVYAAVFPHAAHEHEAALTPEAGDPVALENDKVSGAIKTDFILSAEIMAITLGALPQQTFWMQALVLALVAVGITALVYGGVALIVKADDAGVMLARVRGRGLFSRMTRAFGRGMVKAMPGLLSGLSVAGTAAMLWVGGGIILHGLEGYGLGAPTHLIHDAAGWVGGHMPVAGAFADWLVNATGAGLFGLALGIVLIPLAGYVIAPVVRLARRG